MEEEILNESNNEPRLVMNEPCCENRREVDDRPERILVEKPYDLNIEHMNRGYVVRIGCQRIAVEKKETLIEYLTKYINDPAKTIEEYNKGLFLPK